MINFLISFVLYIQILIPFVSLQNTNMKHFIVSVVGNVGSGKTSLLSNIASERSDTKVYCEPVGKWQNVGSHNWLQLFYDEPKRYSLTFQSTVLASFRGLFDEIQASSERISLVERSYLDGLNVFAPNLVENNLMRDEEFAALKYLGEIMFRKADRIDGFIYLRTDPELCFERTKKRDRNEESSVSLSYLKTLHDKYDEWVTKLSSENPDKVLVVDNNADYLSNQYRANQEVVTSFLDRLVSTI